MLPDFLNSKIIIHIAFHFIENRFQFLQSVINYISNYKFKKIDIFIDCNSEEIKKYSFLDRDKTNIDIKYLIHKNLDHPFLLTWTHRQNMYKNLSKYDYFMYIEDDIAVPFSAIQQWKIDTEILFPFGYLRGFLRVEKSSDNVLRCTDQTTRAKIDNFSCLNNTLYFRPSNPYQAFWIYDKSQMNIFVNNRCWHDGNHPSWEIRERASSGMIWLDQSEHKVLIPLTDRLTIPDNVLVYHLPNNYAIDTNSPFGKVPITDLTNNNTILLHIKKFICNKL